MVNRQEYDITMSITGKSILKTIVYYDCLDYPLTKEELEFFSFKNENGPAKDDLIESAGGFYFLKGRGKLLKIRKERNELAKNKWKKALRAVRLLRFIPYIRLVFGSGSLVLGNTNKESDLDFLIIAKHGRIWTARSLAVFLLNFLGLLRRRGQITAPDRVCLNHFITDKSLHIPRKSIYTAQLYARLAPVTRDEKLIDEFIKANSWISNYIPGWPECVKNQKANVINYNSNIRSFLEKILDTKFGDWVEAVFRKYNLHRIKNYHLTYKSGGRVKADDDSLEFHPDSPELIILEKYNQKMIGLGFEDLTEDTSFD
ncbi:MAG: hypothetical protein A3I22_00510 [Parcubacteria group bacterium RIFCSPLOWO2_02_FULL_40_12]|nr:MAG: hypothetical protein A3I22_00510 [Parcubacteria group bacterium RIFCSPLOWO2_02_FULL_40_12]